MCKLQTTLTHSRIENQSGMEWYGMESSGGEKQLYKLNEIIIYEVCYNEFEIYNFLFDLSNNRHTYTHTTVKSKNIVGEINGVE